MESKQLCTVLHVHVKTTEDKPNDVLHKVGNIPSCFSDPYMVVCGKGTVHILSSLLAMFVYRARKHETHTYRGAKCNKEVMAGSTIQSIKRGATSNTRNCYQLPICQRTVESVLSSTRRLLDSPFTKNTRITSSDAIHFSLAQVCPRQQTRLPHREIIR